MVLARRWCLLRPESVCRDTRKQAEPAAASAIFIVIIGCSVAKTYRNRPMIKARSSPGSLECGETGILINGSIWPGSGYSVSGRNG
ncbi:hypothetical protein KCP70_03500 [Salmonella enterica subsp. enterica]|nr:hypothetical protein KCP70_03500 [Salmonella enterica subsp. enterica]